VGLTAGAGAAGVIVSIQNQKVRGDNPPVDPSRRTLGMTGGSENRPCVERGPAARLRRAIRKKKPRRGTGSRPLRGDGDTDTPASATAVVDDRLRHAQEKLERRFDEVFRLRPGDQHSRSDGEVSAEKLFASGEVGDRCALPAPGNQTVKSSQRRGNVFVDQGVERGAEFRQQSCPIDAKRQFYQNQCVQPRRRAVRHRRFDRREEFLYRMCSGIRETFVHPRIILPLSLRR
jgi:hypothetical protein